MTCIFTYSSQKQTVRPQHTDIEYLSAVILQFDEKCSKKVSQQEMYKKKPFHFPANAIFYLAKMKVKSINQSYGNKFHEHTVLTYSSL